jgi:hypothetical protein
MHSPTDPETVLKFIRYLRQKGYLDKETKFCDPFGGGFVAMLVHAATGAEATAYETNHIFHDEAMASYHRLVQFGAIEPGRVTLVHGSSTSADLRAYDVFYLYPPMEDGTFASLPLVLVINGMKHEALFLAPFNLRSPGTRQFIPATVLDVDKSIQEIEWVGGLYLYRRVVNSKTDEGEEETVEGARRSNDEAERQQ